MPSSLLRHTQHAAAQPRRWAPSTPPAALGTAPATTPCLKGGAPPSAALACLGDAAVGGGPLHGVGEQVGGGDDAPHTSVGDVSASGSARRGKQRSSSAALRAAYELDEGPQQGQGRTAHTPPPPPPPPSPPQPPQPPSLQQQQQQQQPQQPQRRGRRGRRKQKGGPKLQAGGTPSQSGAVQGSPSPSPTLDSLQRSSAPTPAAPSSDAPEPEGNAGQHAASFIEEVVHVRAEESYYESGSEGSEGEDDRPAGGGQTGAASFDQGAPAGDEAASEPVATGGSSPADGAPSLSATSTSTSACPPSSSAKSGTAGAAMRDNEEWPGFAAATTISAAQSPTLDDDGLQGTSSSFSTDAAPAAADAQWQGIGGGDGPAAAASFTLLLPEDWAHATASDPWPASLHSDGGGGGQQEGYAAPSDSGRGDGRGGASGSSVGGVGVPPWGSPWSQSESPWDALAPPRMASEPSEAEASKAASRPWDWPGAEAWSGSESSTQGWGGSAGAEDGRGAPGAEADRGRVAAGSSGLGHDAPIPPTPLLWSWQDAMDGDFIDDDTHVPVDEGAAPQTATPGAATAATPGATPHATPGATPKATPVADLSKAKQLLASLPPLPDPWSLDGSYQAAAPTLSSPLPGPWSVRGGSDAAATPLSSALLDDPWSTATAPKDSPGAALTTPASAGPMSTDSLDNAAVTPLSYATPGEQARVDALPSGSSFQAAAAPLAPAPPDLRLMGSSFQAAAEPASPASPDPWSTDGSYQAAAASLSSSLPSFDPWSMDGSLSPGFRDPWGTDPRRAASLSRPPASPTAASADPAEQLDDAASSKHSSSASLASSATSEWGRSATRPVWPSPPDSPPAEVAAEPLEGPSSSSAASSTHSTDPSQASNPSSPSPLSQDPFLAGPSPASSFTANNDTSQHSDRVQVDDPVDNSASAPLASEAAVTEEGGEAVTAAGPGAGSELQASEGAETGGRAEAGRERGEEDAAAASEAAAEAAAAAGASEGLHGWGERGTDVSQGTAASSTLPEEWAQAGAPGASAPATAVTAHPVDGTFTEGSLAADGDAPQEGSASAPEPKRRKSKWSKWLRLSSNDSPTQPEAAASATQATTASSPAAAEGDAESASHQSDLAAFSAEDERLGVPSHPQEHALGEGQEGEGHARAAAQSLLRDDHLSGPGDLDKEAEASIGSPAGSGSADDDEAGAPSPAASGNADEKLLEPRADLLPANSSPATPMPKEQTLQGSARGPLVDIPHASGDADVQSAPEAEGAGQVGVRVEACTGEGGRVLSLALGLLWCWCK